MDTHILKTDIGTTKIAFGSGLEQLANVAGDRPVTVITDAHIAKLYQAKLSAYQTIIIPRGEAAKTISRVERVADELLSRGADRTAMLVGVGGGSVCDFTGFLASIYKRGVDFGFVPTTLLAQVDAAIGGKNGVDLGEAKNMLGVYNAPEFILIDPTFCRTLTDAEYRNGFAEVIKHALIADSSLFSFLLEKRIDLISQESAVLSTCVRRAALIKMQIVVRDARESGERKLLNFGHTLGHAIEQTLNISHGQAVSIGMAADLEISKKLGLLSSGEVRQAVELIRGFGLPTNNPMRQEEYWPLLTLDKKATGEVVDYIVLDEIGRGRIERIPFGQLKSLLG